MLSQSPSTRMSASSLLFRIVVVSTVLTGFFHDTIAGPNAKENKLLSFKAEACQSASYLIQEAEGFRACPYEDTTGHLTVCYGFNLQAAGARSKVEAVGGDYDSLMSQGTCLVKDQCEKLFNEELLIAEKLSQRVFGKQCPCVAAVLADMSYNLGSKIAAFHNMINAINNQNWHLAASEARDSLWCSQVTKRCDRDVAILYGGCS